MLRKLGEESNHAQSIVQVAQGIDKSRVSIFDNRREVELRRDLLVSLCLFVFFAAKQLLMLFQVRFNLVELAQKLVVFQNFQIFCVEVSLVVTLELLARFAGVDAFKDTNAAEI